jgi:hypothetical protein
MSSTRLITTDSSLLAEAVAGGLHSLAQPLTATLWRLESAVMNNSGTEQHQTDLSEALVALEGVVAQLNILQDLIRPFRMETKYISESLREALLSGHNEQQEALLHEGVQIVLRDGCAEGIVVTPQGFLQRITFCLFSLLRTYAPVFVDFDINETDQYVLLIANLRYPAKQEEKATAIHSCSTIRSYVEALAGDFTIAQDLSFIRISLPKWASSI